MRAIIFMYISTRELFFLFDTMRGECNLIDYVVLCFICAFRAAASAASKQKRCSIEDKTKKSYEPPCVCVHRVALTGSCFALIYPYNIKAIYKYILVYTMIYVHIRRYPYKYMVEVVVIFRLQHRRSIFYLSFLLFTLCPYAHTT